MKNRLSNLSKPASRLLCLLTACGLAYSCTDEYTLDDEKPSDLSTSIYQGLVDKGVYSTYLKLLSDPAVNTGSRSLVDVLNRTGSKTVFVANNAAYQEFFDKNKSLPETNPWHYATSYAALSPSQKKLLVHCSMLNNAMTLENLASSEAGSTGRPVRGEYLRRFTDVVLTDTISKLYGDQIPHHYNANDKDYWYRFRPTTPGEKGRGIYLVNDGTRSMMIHFTNEQMKKVGITDEDFEIIMGSPRSTEDVHVYDSKIKSQDLACENGYINQMEKVIKPLPNMAEVIRTSGMTNIFSHILDRFSAPFYDEAVTRAYRDLNPHTFGEFDSIFTKRYFSKNSVDNAILVTDPDGETISEESGTTLTLKFDPGWNEYNQDAATTRKEEDMASMFVPNDEAMRKYFSPGEKGWFLLETYCVDPGLEAPQETLEDLYKKIDQIPKSVISSFVSNIMFPSFNNSVPSKMTTLRNDAQEQIFFSGDKAKIDTVLLGCNGAVYVMNDVYIPADYASVAAPAFITNTNNVMRWAIYNGFDPSEADKMGLNYYAYLKAMRSEFTLLLPSDAALRYYHDPLSLKIRTQRSIGFNYKSSTTSIPITCDVYGYNAETGEQGRKQSTGKVTEEEIPNRLKDILESHTIVHTSENPRQSEDEYYLTKNGSAIKITRKRDGSGSYLTDEDGHYIIEKIQGGFQLENEAAGIIDGSPGSSVCNVDRTYKQGNGHTLLMGSPIIPTSKNVYDILSGTNQAAAGLENPYAKFFALAIGNEEMETIIKRCGLVDEKLEATKQARELKKYQVFVDVTDPKPYSESYKTGVNGVGYTVSFFNNYRYTILAPTNEAIDKAIQNGLPTWDEITADFNALKNADGELTCEEDSILLQTKITYLQNFIRAHFADDSFFADRTGVTLTAEEESKGNFVTSSYDNESGTFIKIKMWRTQNGDNTSLYVQDIFGGPRCTTTENKNTMARDVFTNQKLTASTRNLNNVAITSSSFAVIHGIDGTLSHTSLVNGKHDSQWANTSAAKRYLKKYHIR